MLFIIGPCLLLLSLGILIAPNFSNETVNAILFIYPLLMALSIPLLIKTYTVNDTLSLLCLSGFLTTEMHEWAYWFITWMLGFTYIDFPLQWYQPFTLAFGILILILYLKIGKAKRTIWPLFIFFSIGFINPSLLLYDTNIFNMSGLLWNIFLTSRRIYVWVFLMLVLR